MDNHLRNCFSAVHGTVLFGTATSIMEVNVDTHNVNVLVKHGDTYVLSLDYDYQHGLVYFPRSIANDIVR